MKMVGRSGNVFTAKPDRDEAGTTGAELGPHEPDHLGAHDLFENDLYRETLGSGPSSARKEEKKVDDDKDRDIIAAVKDDEASTIDKSSVLASELMGSVQAGTEEAADENDNEDNGTLDIIEKEGDIKPSAIDELMKWVGNDYDADDEDDW
jgi:hypothetical protein